MPLNQISKKLLKTIWHRGLFSQGPIQHKKQIKFPSGQAMPHSYAGDGPPSLTDFGSSGGWAV